MSAKRLWCGALCLMACTFESTPSTPQDSAPPQETSGDEGGSTAGVATGGPVSGTTSPPITATAGGETSPTLGETTGETTGQTTDETGDVEVKPGCPDPLPENWVLCEDFEGVGDLASHFSAVDGSGLAIGGPGFESRDALEVTHFAQQNWVGELLIRFGQGPSADNITQPDARFEEVWVRARFRADRGWPVRGPGDLLSVDGVEGPDWAATFKARISAGQSEPAVRNSAFSCVFGSQHPCDGTDDWSLLAYLGGEPGQVVVFDESVVHQWHCAVIHARLNTAGSSDGLLEVLVDGQSDASVTGLDFRGSRSDLGFNVVSIPTYMESALQNDHRRYIDDVVVSTESLDCE